MHSVKGGWVGQTFALAKRNESEGRKSRIRRSKEERKAMVESFIKKYQESNNGNFPSLNLTHKEVGGSFYTVREIVRDIIQENRVLGPAKFDLEELTSDKFFEQNPLGSIARDPEASLVASSNENHHEPNNLVDAREFMVPVSDGYNTVAEHQMVDKGHVINDSWVDVINKDSIEATSPELQISEPMAFQQTVEQELATATKSVDEVTPVTADLIVETFPLRPVATTTNIIEGVGELKGSRRSPENVIQMMKLQQGEKRSESNVMEPTKNSNLLDEKHVDDLGTLISGNNSNTSHDNDKYLGNTLAESAKHSTQKENFGHEFEDCTDPQVRVAHQNTITFETINQGQMINGAETSIQDDFQAKNLTKTYTEGSKSSEEGLEKADKRRIDAQLVGSSQRRSSPTLDRINLESWDGTPKNSAKHGSNPLLAILKAFVDAFVKFWSE